MNVAGGEIEAREESHGSTPEDDRVLHPFEARDGRVLQGVLRRSPEARGAVLIAPATGIRASFYRRFAEYLAEQGLSSLVFDYRGIGRSRSGDLRSCRARKQDWGQLDMPGALDALARQEPGVPLALVGHSAGGQLVGLMDNVSRLSCIVQISCSSGYVGGMSFGFGLLSRVLLFGYLPLSTRLFGYTPVKRIGWGEDLPAGVGTQWAEWCSRPGYVANALGKTVEIDYHDAVRCPLLNVSATDDPIATEANVQDLVRLYPHAEVTTERVEPGDVGVSQLGHMGLFRSSGAPIWPRVAQFIHRSAEARSATSADA
jgi:predicted alpha/beta hydrolase